MAATYKFITFDNLKAFAGQVKLRITTELNASLGNLTFNTKEPGKFVSAVEQTDGQISATYSEIQASDVHVDSSTTLASKLESIESSISDLEGSVNDLSITSTDKTIKVTGDSTNGFKLDVNYDGSTIVKSDTGVLSVSPTATSVSGESAIQVTTDNGKKVSLKIKSGEKVLSQSTDGLESSLKLNFDSASKKLQVLGVSDTVVSEIDASDFVMDGILESVELEGSELTFNWNTDAEGKVEETSTTIDLANYIKPYSAGNGLNLTSETFVVKIKENDKYLQVDSDGVASKGIDEAITAAVHDLEADITSTGGSKVTVKVTEADGKVNKVEVTENDIASATELASLASKVETFVGEGEGSVSEQIADAVKEAIEDLDVTTSTGDFVQAVGQTEGKVTFTEGSWSNVFVAVDNSEITKLFED